MRSEAVVLGEEVRRALQEGRPVVALESSVLVQGLPAPRNLASTEACAAAIRAAGAVPALTALVAGRPTAGLTHDQIAQLVDPATRARKAASRDFAPALAKGWWGATTVSATCAIADAAGIRLFATGGIGGVHREAERTFDVSQDLLAIARFRVAVVTAGAKAVLDLPKTLEALEALAVPVVGFRTSELPAFYSGRSGLSLEHRVDSPEEAARLLWARWEELGEGGVIIANPIPENSEADPSLVNAAVDAALAEAKLQGVTGKALTPFLLAEVARRTGGESVEANLALLIHNARIAAQIAVALQARRP